MLSLIYMRRSLAGYASVRVSMHMIVKDTLLIWLCFVQILYTRALARRRTTRQLDRAFLDLPLPSLIIHNLTVLCAMTTLATPLHPISTSPLSAIVPVLAGGTTMEHLAVTSYPRILLPTFTNIIASMSTQMNRLPAPGSRPTPAVVGRS